MKCPSSKFACSFHPNHLALLEAKKLYFTVLVAPSPWENDDSVGADVPAISLNGEMAPTYEEALASIGRTLDAIVESKRS